MPTSTGDAKATALVLPELKVKLDGMALRAPVSNVSLVDLVVDLEKEVTKGEVNEVFKKYEADAMKGILGVSDQPLVSRDFNIDPRRSIIDSDLTMVMDGNKDKVFSQNDN